MAVTPEQLCAAAVNAMLADFTHFENDEIEVAAQDGHLVVSGHGVRARCRLCVELIDDDARVVGDKSELGQDSSGDEGSP